MSIVVRAKPGESTDKVISRFFRAVNREGLLDEIRYNQFYQKPSQLRKEKKKLKKRKIFKYLKEGMKFKNDK